MSALPHGARDARRRGGRRHDACSVVPHRHARIASPPASGSFDEPEPRFVSAPATSEATRVAGIAPDTARAARHAARGKRNRGDLAMQAEQTSAITALLARNGLLPFAGRRILEVDCASGEHLSSFKELGASSEHLYGVDRSEEDIARARLAHPDVHWQCADGAALDFAPGFFGLVVAFSVFSVASEERAEKLAAEMQRVLHPDGALLWYDVRRRPRRARGERGAPLEEVCRLFPGWRIDVERVVLRPWLARRLGFTTRVLYPLLASLPPLRSHLLGVLRPPPSEK